ncbi:MAG: hypothetical protein AAGM22_21870 [Acidobacteriota bacterium]
MGGRRYGFAGLDAEGSCSDQVADGAGNGLLGGSILALALSLVLSFAGPAFAGDAGEIGGCGDSVPLRVLEADPSTYLALLGSLQPGDVLRLAPGDYLDGLNLRGIEGLPGACITVEGPPTGVARFPGRNCCNTVSLGDSAYLVIRRLELEGAGGLGDAVKAESTASYAHHITLEDLYIYGHDVNQQIVGINSKCPAWNWVIRRNTIEDTGTGIYLGDSNGEDEFSAGLIEHNLIRDTIGYNLQIKHQNGRATDLGAPAQAYTVIRHNVFSKAQNGSSGAAARPNVLVGHWPLAGAGASDEYLIYGNFFHQNPTEGLFQGEGNIAFYRNVLVNDAGDAVNIQPHNDVPKSIRVVGNTVVASDTGLRIAGADAGFEQRQVANAVFAATALVGGVQVANVSDSRANADLYLENPFGALAGADRLSVFPRPGALVGGVDGAVELAGLPGGDLDFDALPARGERTGAYDGGAASPGWALALERKALSSLFVDGFESGDLSAWSDIVP